MVKHASMGPRPRGRGNGSMANAGTVTTSALQWGRDRAVAEIKLRHSWKRSPCCFNGAATARSRKYPAADVTLGDGVDASMGPRPRGRGNVNRSRAQTSTTPLQWGRDRAVAELLTTSVSEVQRTCFNGAATARSRKSPCANLPCSGVSPASMGPRPRGRGNMALDITALQTAVALQWGRDRAVAEMGNLSKSPPTPKLLQWGRDRAVAEMRVSTWTSPATTWCFNGAATARSRKSRHGPPPSSMPCCFNGAATARSRKFRSAWRVRRARPSLQWGRDRAVAEMAKTVTANAIEEKLQWGRDRAVAEMTPYSAGRRSKYWLQWGRDRAVAEIHAGFRNPNGRLRFNGAATARSRKLPKERRDDARRGASMGPRPRGRGNVATLPTGQPVGTASMGPRPRGRGNVRGRNHVLQVHRASMGPRPRGRGNTIT